LVSTYGGGEQKPAPILAVFDGPFPQRRVTVFFRLILAIPAGIVLFAVLIAAFFVIVIAWFGALFMGRLPTFAAEFLPGVVRWQTRVQAYTFLLTDKYPPFSMENDDTYPVRVTALPGRLNRWAVFFRAILAIPALIVQNLVYYGTFTIMAVITWLIVLVMGRMPVPLFQAMSAAIRYQARVAGYTDMITSEYPWGLFGDSPIPPGPSAAYGAPAVAGPHGSPGAYGTPGAYGAPPAPGAYGAPTAPGTYGAPPPPTPGTFGAPPVAGAVGGYGAPPPPDPAAVFSHAPQTPPAPAPPFLPGVAFTFGGASYLWGYVDDRSYCGIWSAHDLSAQPQMWPIGEQGEGWTRFRELEPHAVALAEPTPPPSVSPWGQATTSSYAAPPVGPFGGASYSAGSWPAEDPRWRIVLSRGAKWLIVLFLIIGAIINVFFRAPFFHPSIFKGLEAEIKVSVAYASLTASETSYRTATSACQSAASPLSCFTAADQNMVQAFESFGQTVNSTSIPAGATAAASTLLDDAAKARLVFVDLSQSSTISQYQQTFQTSNVNGVFAQVDQDYRALTHKLT
jgi:hypothetical protein